MEKYKHLLIAIAEDKQLQFLVCSYSGRWRDLDKSNYAHVLIDIAEKTLCVSEFRVKPDTVKINGVDYVAPVKITSERLDIDKLRGTNIVCVTSGISAKAVLYHFSNHEDTLYFHGALSNFGKRDIA